jgi:hypothetical protein
MIKYNNDIFKNLYKIFGGSASLEEAEANASDLVSIIPSELFEIINNASEEDDDEIKYNIITAYLSDKNLNDGISQPGNPNSIPIIFIFLSFNLEERLQYIDDFPIIAQAQQMNLSIPLRIRIIRYLYTKASADSVNFELEMMRDHINVRYTEITMTGNITSLIQIDKFSYLMANVLDSAPDTFADFDNFLMLAQSTLQFLNHDHFQNNFLTFYRCVRVMLRGFTIENWRNPAFVGLINEIIFDNNILNKFIKIANMGNNHSLFETKQLIEILDFIVNNITLQPNFFIKLFDSHFVSRFYSYTLNPPHPDIITNLDLYFDQCIGIILGGSESNRLRLLDICPNGDTLLHRIISQFKCSNMSPASIAALTNNIILILNATHDLILAEGIPNERNTILSSNRERGSSTILHNILFAKKYHIRLILRLLDMYPQLLNIYDIQRRYPSFYVAEFTQEDIEITRLVATRTDPNIVVMPSIKYKKGIEFIMRNLMASGYGADLLRLYIRDNDHLPLINSAYLLQAIANFGADFFTRTMLYEGKTLGEIIAYLVNKLRRLRDPRKNVIIQNLNDILINIQYQGPFFNGGDIAGIRINRNNDAIREYITKLITQGQERSTPSAPINGLQAANRSFVFIGEQGGDFGGVSRNAWGHMINIVTDVFCDIKYGNAYFNTSLTSDEFRMLGRFIGRGYRFGPPPGSDLRIFTSVGILPSNLSQIIKLELFLTEPLNEGLRDRMILADSRPSLKETRERIYEILKMFSIDFIGQLGQPLDTISQDTINEVIRTIIEDIFGLYYDDPDTNTQVVELYQTFIRNITFEGDTVNRNFIDFIRLFHVRFPTATGRGDDLKQNQFRIFKECLEESEFLRIVTENEMNISRILAIQNTPRVIESLNFFTEHKDDIIQGINDVIYGFFEVDRRRIMNLNIKPITITKAFLRNATRYEYFYGGEDLTKITTAIDILLTKLDQTGDLVKYVQYFSGIPIILSRHQTYGWHSTNQALINAHQCFNYIDIPITMIRGNTAQEIAEMLEGEIQSTDYEFNAY